MAVTAAIILRHTAAFLEQVLSRPELRHRILSSARLKLPSPLHPALLHSLALIDDDTSSSLASAQKLLLQALPPATTPLSSLLLSLTYARRRRRCSAALALLDLFVLDPALARSELALPVFENLFIPHLLPAIQWFSDRRSHVISSTIRSDESDDNEEEEEEEEGSRSMAFEAMSVLSRMSGGQTEELRELQREYENVMDDNCRIYAEYLKKILEGSDGLSPPQLVFNGVTGDDLMEVEGTKGAIGSDTEKGCYNNNPMWNKADQSVEFSGRQSSKGRTGYNTKASPSYPQRVQPSHLLNRQPSYQRGSFMSQVVDVDDDDDSSAEYKTSAKEENNTDQSALSLNDQGQEDQWQEQTSLESTCSLRAAMADSDSFPASGKRNPPKDFVCPITSNIFNDPVTLETGQTYERKAIQEWLDRGNSTCPITRQKLSCTLLPKTNYVLKRLIASWQEQDTCSPPVQIQSENRPPPPPFKDVPQTSPLLLAPSPTSVISQASTDGTSADLRLAISQLCTSEILDESEMAVLQIEQLWRESGMEPEILSALSKPAVINGFVEILFNSVDSQVLRSTVFLLTELVSKDRFVVQTLTRVDSDVECMVTLFKKGLVETVVLIYLLNLSWESLVAMDMNEALMMTIKKREEEDSFGMCLKPRTASTLLLWQMMRGDTRTASALAGALVLGRVVESVVVSLKAELVEERIAAVGILARCMEEDGNCRNMIADRAELTAVMQSFTMVISDTDRFEIVRFLYELVKLSRRTFNQQLLQMIKDQGVFSTMHTLLIYLQTALQDQSPIIAALLLQLDLLVEPKMMSVYREEAIDALISCLKDSDFPKSQLLAAETILCLQGRFSYSGKPLVRALLLKHAGMNKSYRALMRAEQFGYVLEDPDENMEEEKVADEWERSMAYALVSHEFGLLFEALADGMKSKNSELFSACLVSATWLVHMLSIIPDTGIRGAARVCLLKRYISVLKTTKIIDEKALVMLALRSFINDPEGVNSLTFHIKDIMKTVRELKKSSALAYEMLKLLSDGKESSTHDFWNHKELNQVDCSTNGEVLSIVCFRNRIFSGHSDGTIKVWSGSDNILDQIQEINEHTKAVTSLAILESGDKLYSGSLDKTVKVWSIREGKIFLLEVLDMKDQVHNLTVANTIACFSPQGAGVKVFSWNGGSKLLNPNKYVKCLALVHGKLYCGCHDNSIQEIDLATGTSGTIQTGNKKLLGKSSPICALQVSDGLLYSASTTSDGAAVKIYNASNYSPVGSLPSPADVRSIAISTDLIYMGCKTGLVDIWSKEKLTRIGSLQTKTYSKVQCMALDGEGEVLIVGTSDGRIQAWGLT